MKPITDAEDLLQLEDDNIFIGEPPALRSSKITFNGKNNLLYCESGVSLASCNITFKGDNGLLMLGRDKHGYIMDLSINNNCTAVFGRDVYFNGTLHAILSEECTLIVGSTCLLSFGIWIRTADPHLIYDTNTHQRLNYSKNIILGDHVWIGQNAFVLKGTTVGSGSIVGAMSVLSGKTVPSNTVWAGNPAKCVRENVFWDGKCVHTWTKKKTREYAAHTSDEYIYPPDGDTIDPDNLIAEASCTAQERLRHYLCSNYDHEKHNRMAISSNAINEENDQHRSLRGLFPKLHHQ